jgi:hypothetical protein
VPTELGPRVVAYLNTRRLRRGAWLSQCGSYGLTPRAAGGGRCDPELPRLKPVRSDSEMTNGLDPNRGPWDAEPMTQATKKLLEEIEALSDTERSELVAELTRKIALAPHDLPSDTDFVAAADRLFSELDRRESSE